RDARSRSGGTMRRWSWLLCSICLGCQTIAPAGLDEARPRRETLAPSSLLLDQVGKALEAGDGEKGCALLQEYIEAPPAARAPPRRARSGRRSAGRVDPAQGGPGADGGAHACSRGIARGVVPPSHLARAAPDAHGRALAARGSGACAVLVPHVRGTQRPRPAD